MSESQGLPPLKISLCLNYSSKILLLRLLVAGWCLSDLVDFDCLRRVRSGHDAKCVGAGQSFVQPEAG